MSSRIWRIAAIAALATVPAAALAAPASAQTSNWASGAVASSEFGNGGSACTGSVDPSVPNVCRPGVGVSGAGGSDPTGLGFGGWSASQATGAPDTYPNCGDISTAWAPATSGTDPESITLFYSPVDNATQVDIYETNIGGFVTQVNVLRPDGTQNTVFTGPDTTLCPGILSIPVSGSVAGVDIHTQAPGWEEIDAVGVVN